METPEERREPTPVEAVAEAADLEDERRRLRRLQIMMSMVMSVIGQDPSLTVDEACELAAGARRAALAMFPGKELAFDLLYRPRLQRLLRERYNVQ
ncbi:MAG: hypothetical protein L0099_16590 [Acidobacteria bacterium]|nr:hypothetical protein [Acidobacteriota bacterium]